MDYQAVPPPSNYGAPQVFQQQGQGAQGQQQQNPMAAALAKAKQLLSSGQISPDQYTQIAQKFGGQPGTELATSGGNMGAGMPGGVQPGAPMNILPGAGA